MTILLTGFSDIGHFGRHPSGRAIRCNLFAELIDPAKRISTSIPDGFALTAASAFAT